MKSGDAWPGDEEILMEMEGDVISIDKQAVDEHLSKLRVFSPIESEHAFLAGVRWERARAVQERREAIQRELKAHMYDIDSDLVGESALRAQKVTREGKNK